MVSAIVGSGAFLGAVPPQLGGIVAVESFVGETVSFDLAIQNRSEATLKVLGARQTDFCGIDGCRELSGFPLEIAPHSSGIVKGRFTARRPGTIRQEIVLISDDPRRREMPLRLVIHAATRDVRSRTLDHAGE
jgi:hypothetical protein